MQRFSVVFLLGFWVACAGSQAKVAEPQAAQAQAGDPVSADVRGAGQASQVERIYELNFPEQGPVLGPAEAKVTLDVCSDFQCPFCARMVPTIHELAENYDEL